MSYRVSIVALLTIAVAIGGALVSPRGSDAESSLSTLSNKGKTASSLGSDASQLQRARTNGQVALLGQRGDRAYYRIGGGCYSVGPANAMTNRFGSVACVPNFPTPDRPVLPFIVMHGEPDRGLSVFRSEGFAADGVASVAFQTASGEYVGKVAVRDNIFRHATIPDGNLVAFVAFGVSGVVVEKYPLLRSGH